jgi:hypothetical protein
MFHCSVCCSNMLCGPDRGDASDMETYKYCNLYSPWFKPMDSRGLVQNKICENRKQITMWRQSRIIECSSDVGFLFGDISVTWTTSSCTPSSRLLLREQALRFVVSYSRPCGRRSTETAFQTVLTSESVWHKVYFGQCILPVACLLGTESWNPSSPLVSHYYFLYASFRYRR